MEQAEKRDGSCREKYQGIMKRVLVAKFDVPLQPLPYERARVNSFGRKPRFFTNPKEREWRKNLVAGVVATWGTRQPLDEPLAVSVRCIFPRPRKPKFWCPAIRPDVDNLAKQIGDSLNNVVWSDDSRIVDLCVSKQFGDKPAVEIEVYRYE